LNDHQKFRELSALANSNTLTGGEWAELKEHLQTCEECREVHDQFLILTSEGIPLLAARYAHHLELGTWSDRATRTNLLARVQLAGQLPSSKPVDRLHLAVQPNLPNTVGRMPVKLLSTAALAACLVVAIGVGAYRLGSRAQARLREAPPSTEDHFQSLAEENTPMRELLDAKSKRVFKLQEEAAQRERRLIELQSALRMAEDRANELAAANSATAEQLGTVSKEHKDLSGQLRNAEQAYLAVQAEIATLRAERNKAIDSLESRIEELSAVNQDQDRRLRNDAEYLVADRDIRELIGARNLYIADVMDVDGNSHTRKPFGRVFYANGSSLIFYAFDLSPQKSSNITCAFQAWGSKETEVGKPLNLGIFYVDNIDSRRWVLRFDDPQRLAEINAVFVTVEPHGGSQRPTGKPFLYTMLRKEPNHP
jgi:hypothetical protein